MHAHAFSVSFPCVNLNKQGSREPQTIKLKRTKVHAFCMHIHEITLTNNKLNNQITECAENPTKSRQKKERK